MASPLRKFTWLALLLALLALGAACPPPDGRLVGEWAAVGQGHGGTVLRFEPDGTFLMREPREETRGSYETDFGKDPHWLDFISADRSRRTECVLRFNNPDEFVVVIGRYGSRPADIDTREAATYRRLVR
jgi:hypothetical protein